MRVSLNYYRILALPLQTTDVAKIEAAYKGRLAQPLLAGFSADLLAARAQLLADARQTLIMPTQRAAYTEQLLVADQALDVTPEQAVASVAVLAELGEYDAALDLAETLQQQGLTNPDVVLAATWAFLLWGREQWQAANYEVAAARLQAGLGVLQGAQAFPELQASIQQDLRKLRPYRVMQLLDYAAEGSPERQQGLMLLQALLDERHGIDGSSDDGSGLSTEDFLRFTQKIRTYMTVAEQQSLFEAEAERPSTVATYLAVSALMVAGFVEHRPILIRRAKGYLVRLGIRHDVCVEQAMCSLLLGQTDGALQALAQCQEQEALRFIREHSADDVDLLPGLCRYLEHWLAIEALPGFRGLAQTTVAISDYFDDPAVQTYLTTLSDGTEATGTDLLDLPVFAPVDSSSPPPLAVGEPVPYDVYPEPHNYPSEPVPPPYSLPPREPEVMPEPRRRRRAASKAWLWQLSGGVLVLFLLWLMGRALMALFSNPVPPPVEPPLATLESPPVAIDSEPTPPPPPPVPTSLDAALAESLVGDWQTAKQAAMGQEHTAVALEGILAEPLLSQWRSRSQQLADVSAYYIYTFQGITVETVTAATEGSGTAVVEIKEAARYWQDGVEIAGNSYDSTYRVRYTFERQGDRWLMTNAEQL